MKKVLMTLVAVLAISFASFAQDTHWPEFNLYQYQFNLPLVAFVQIDGEYVTVDNYTNFEIAAFVGDQCRGHMFMDDYTGDGDPYPIVEINYYYTTTGDVVTFQMWDHTTGTLYENCITNREIITGEDDVELYFDYDNALIMNFISGEPVAETFYLDITGYVGETDNYYLIPSPIGEVAAANVVNLMSNDYDFYSFDQIGEGDETHEYLEWVNLRGQEDYTLMPGMGYLYANSEDVTLEFTGLPIEADSVVVPLAYEESALDEWKGYNLIGNPYADLAYIVDGRDFYRMVNGEFQTPDPEDPESYNIEAMEGVLVQADDENDTLVVFKQAGAGGGSIIPDKKVIMNVTEGRALVDRAVIRFGEGRQLSKIQFNSNHTKLYIPQDGVDYAVVRAAEMGEMPVNFKAEKNGTYMLSFTTSNVEFGYLHLIDNLTGADVDLLVNPSYSFEASTTDYASRFKLVFAMGSNEESFAFYSNGSFVISNEGEATLQVVDVTGRILSSESISGCANVNVKAAAGVYMLRLINGDNVKVQKVIVK